MTIKLITENGEVMTTIGNSHGAIERYVPLANNEAFRCVGFIDPYGHTVFNGLQVESLISELRKLQLEAEPEHRPFIEEVIVLAKRVDEAPHRYLKFIGD